MARLSAKRALQGFMAATLFLVVAFLIQSAIRLGRGALAASACEANLKRLGLALIAYADVHGKLPPAYLADKEGKPAHSWRVLLLPFLGRQDLHAAYRFDEPWNGPNNRKLESQIQDVYACPAEHDGPAWRTNYVAVVGSQTVWPGSNAIRLQDITDGSSNTILLVEIDQSDIHWMEPRDLRLADLTPPGSGRIGKRFSSAHADFVHVLFCDGSVRAVKRNTRRQLLHSALTAYSGKPFGGRWLPGEQAAFNPQFPAETDASGLTATDVQPHLEAEIAPGRNYLYCATYQMVWDQLRQMVGEAPQVEGNPPLAIGLNRQPFPPTALDPSCYVARIGLPRDGIVDAIRAEVKRKFPSVTPSLLDTMEPGVIASYAFLQKNLPFKTSFDGLEEPLVFQGTRGSAKVTSFGIKEMGSDVDSFKEQAIVLDYVSDEDFVLSLRTEKDEMILAKVQPLETALATLRAVGDRIRARSSKIAHPDLQLKETLIIPRLAFNILRSYHELEGKRLLNGPWQGLPFLEQRQVIRFLLNENGAVLESEALGMLGNGHVKPAQPRRLVFDKPFLLYAQEKQSQEPYLVLWINNAELMEPAAP